MTVVGVTIGYSDSFLLPKKNLFILKIGVTVGVRVGVSNIFANPQGVALTADLLLLYLEKS